MTVHVPGGGFAGAARLVHGALARAVRPPEAISFSDWIGRNIVLVDGPHAGELWSAAGAPYLVEIADCLSDEHPCNLVTVRKAQQTGASILALAWMIYTAEREPANLLYAAPSIDALRDMNGQKLQPLIEAYERRRGRRLFYSQTSRSGAGSTTYEKKFPGGYLSLANANSAMDLSSKTVRKGVKDELSKWDDIPGRGDPENLFWGRFTAFRRQRSWKILEISTPEIDTGDEEGRAEGHCRVDRSFRRSDQRFWHIDCPNCGEAFVQSWKLFVLDRENPERSGVACPDCGHRLSEAERVVAVRGGRWIATDPGRDRHPGFHIDAFVSLMMTYGAIAEDWVAKTEGKGERAQKDFANLILGMPYAMRGDAPDHVRLMERREDYPENTIPPEGLLRVAGCDVQHGGIWVEVVAFAPDRQSWTVSRRWIEGPTDAPGKGAWAALGELHGETFHDAWGRPCRLDAMAVDAGDGGRANQVYAFARSHPNVFAVKGVAGWSAPAIGTPAKVDIQLDGKRIGGGAMLWPIGTWSLKAEFYTELRKIGRAGGAEADPPGYCHFGGFLDEGYFRQLTAEYLTASTFRGRRVQKWVESGPNHLLDCRVYAKALAEYLGLTRMTDDQWARLRADRGAPPGADAPDLFAVAPKVAEPRAPAPEPTHSRHRGRGTRSKGIDA